MALTPAATDPKRKEILESISKARPSEKDVVNAAWNMDITKGTPEVKDTVAPPAPTAEDKKGK